MTAEQRKFVEEQRRDVYTRSQRGAAFWISTIIGRGVPLASIYGAIRRFDARVKKDRFKMSRSEAGPAAFATAEKELQHA